MLYRLRPHAPLEWSDFPGFSAFRTAIEHSADFDRLDWLRTEERVFSADLLRIALRYGVATRTGLVLEAEHTVDLGRSDTLRVSQQQIDEAQADIRAAHGELMESLIPGWGSYGEVLDQRVRESTEHVAQEADAELAEILEAPIKAALAGHWHRLGGDLPD